MAQPQHSDGWVAGKGDPISEGVESEFVEADDEWRTPSDFIPPVPLGSYDDDDD